MEVFVVLACLYGKGCAQVSSEYYKHAPTLQYFVAHIDQQTKDTSLRKFAEFGAPMLYYRVNGYTVLQLSKELNYEISTTNNILRFSRTF